LSPDIIGAVTLDEWGIDAYRLVVENAVDAHSHGADVRTYAMFTDFIRDHANAICGVRFFDRIRHAHEEHRAPLVINATGGWGPQIAARMGVPYKLRQGKGVHLVLSHRVTNYGVIMYGVDGRQMFFLPHEMGTTIGTTDDDFYGDMDEPPVVEDEVKYIMQAARRVFPSIDRYRKNNTYVGVRPTIYAWGKNEDALSREHAVIDHAADGASGLLSVTGGKLAAYRQLSEEVSDMVAKRLGNHAPCQTHLQPLPGGDRPFDVAKAASALQVSRLAVSRMAYRHGSRTEQILHEVEQDPRAQEEICLCEPVTKAELNHVASQELVRKLVDVRGRTRLAMGACGGCHCLMRASQVWAEARAGDACSQLRELRTAMDATFRARRNVLEGANLASEELNQMTHFLTGNVGPLMKWVATH